MGFFEVLDSIDAVIMGRNASDEVTVYRAMDDLVAALDKRGIKHVHPDDGRLVQSYIRAERVDRFIIGVACSRRVNCPP